MVEEATTANRAPSDEQQSAVAVSAPATTAAAAPAGYRRRIAGAMPRRRTRSLSPPTSNRIPTFLRKNRDSGPSSGEVEAMFPLTGGKGGQLPLLRNNPRAFKQRLRGGGAVSADDSHLGLRHRRSVDEDEVDNPKKPHSHYNFGAPLNHALRRLGRVGVPPRTPPRKAKSDLGGVSVGDDSFQPKAEPSDGALRRRRGRRRPFDDNVHESLQAVDGGVGDRTSSSAAKNAEEKSTTFADELPMTTTNHLRSSVVTIETSRTEKTLVVGPVVDFLTADATLFLFVCLAVAAYPTQIHWTVVIEQGQVPLPCVASWLMVAFAFGHVVQVGDWKSAVGWQSSSWLWLRRKTSSFRPSLIEIQHTADLHAREEVLQEQKRNRHSLFLGALRRSQAKIKFQAAVQQLPPVKQLWDSGAETWSNLDPTRPAKYLWEKTVDPTLDRTKNTVLMQRLLKNPVYRRAKKRLGSGRDDDAAGGGGSGDKEYCIPDARMGRFELPEADTLDEFVIIPMMKLRGMDVFMTDDPETEAATHPWLLRQGLRDVPTVLINVITPWANILIYLEMPSWVDALENLPVYDDDEDDVRALKNFLNGDDDYRNQRLKMIPSVVDGPLAVKVLAPPKRELVVNCSVLPVLWRKYPAKIDSRTGRKLAPTLEIELDCMSNRAMRAMAGILKRNLERLSIDVAVVVQKPDSQEQDEPEACFAMWRFNHIDVSTCPAFPDRFKVEQEFLQIDEETSVRSDPDVRRASTIVRMSSEELQLLATEQ